MPKATKVTQREIERAALVHETNEAACCALGIPSSTFEELCREYGIVMPDEREKRKREEWPR